MPRVLLEWDDPDVIPEGFHRITRMDLKREDALQPRGIAVFHSFLAVDE